MLLEHRSNENQLRRLPRKPWWQLRTWAVRASWVEVSGSDCECGESGEHSKRWQFWWKMMRDGSQRFCDRSKVISNLDKSYKSFGYGSKFRVSYSRYFGGTKESTLYYLQKDVCL